MDTWHAVLHLTRVPACDQIFRQNNFSEQKKSCPWFSGVWKVTKSRWWKQIHLISTGPVPREACSSSRGLPEHPFKDKEISRGELSATAWRRKSLEDSTPSSKDTSAATRSVRCSTATIALATLTCLTSWTCPAQRWNLMDCICDFFLFCQIQAVLLQSENVILKKAQHGYACL